MRNKRHLSIKVSIKTQAFGRLDIEGKAFREELMSTHSKSVLCVWAVDA